MKRVLLLDTSFAALPIHDWLLEEGYEVWTIGNRPKDVLAQRDPTHYLQNDYSDPDLVQRYIDQLSIQYVVPGCTDLSIETAQRIHVPGTRFDDAETYRKLADKITFRALCAELDLPSPRQVPMDLLPSPGRFIAKPTDAFSGHGISIFNGEDLASADQALSAARLASRTGEALVENYVEGQLYSYSCFLEAQDVIDGVIVKENGAVTPYAVDISHVCLDFLVEGLNILNKSIQKLARHLKLVDGLLHIQFIWDGKTPWLIELSRRCPGDLYPRLVELSTGMRHAARYAAYFVGKRLSSATPIRRYILRHTVNAGHENYEGIWFNQSVPMVEFYPLLPIGRDVPPPSRIDRVALLFLEYTSAAALESGHVQFFKKNAYRYLSLYETCP